MIVFCLAAIFSSISVENNEYKHIMLIIISISSLIDAFVMIQPLLLKKNEIKSKRIDSDYYCYRKREFVDRKDIFDDIVFRINQLKKKKGNVMWIMLHGEDGVGKKALISKIYQKFKFSSFEFFFIEENGKKIINQLAIQYPLSTNNSDIDYYSRKFAEKRNVFVIINALSCDDITFKISEFFELWCKLSNKKSKLIVITFDNDRMSRFFYPPEIFSIFEYEIFKLSEHEAASFINKITNINNSNIINKIVKSSNCLPAAIKYICNTLKLYSFQDTDSWLFETLRMRDSLKEKYFELCILTITDNYINYANICKILSREELTYFLSTSKLLSYNEKYYVPIWLINQIRLSGKYHGDFLNSLKKLFDDRILSAELEEKAKILMENDISSIYDKITELYKEGRYIEIKEYYYKLIINYDYEKKTERKILFIFLKTFLILGEYSSFDHLRKELSIPITYNISEDDYNFNLLCADYYHLTSQYSCSNNMFMLLRNNTKVGKDNELNLDFFLAHNYRHEGNLLKSYSIFNRIVSSTANNSIIYKRSITGMISIDYFEDELAFQKDKIDILYNLIDKNDVRYNILRHISNIEKRCNNDIDSAIEILKKQLPELEQKQLRILQDYYFEIGECLRIKCRFNKSYYNEAVTYLNKALLFAEKNHDLNLHLSVQISKYLLQYSVDKNNKLLKKNLQNIVEASNISKIIYYCILTLLSILNKTDLISEQLKELGFRHYLRVLESKDVTSIYVTVM